MKFSTFLQITGAGQMVQLITSSSLYCTVFYQVIFIASPFHNTHCFKAALQKVMMVMFMIS